MPAPLRSRPVDVIYLLFFLIHIPVIFLVDLYPLYPAFIPARLPFLTTLRNYYINGFHDRFSVRPPSWFYAYLWMEALWHVPVSAWAVRALWRDDPRLPLPLLTLAVQTAVTTLTCVVEAMSWTELSSGQKLALAQLYVPYLALALVMGFDMYWRVERRLRAGEGLGLGGKKKL